MLQVWAHWLRDSACHGTSARVEGPLRKILCVQQPDTGTRMAFVYSGVGWIEGRRGFVLPILCTNLSVYNCKLSCAKRVRLVGCSCTPVQFFNFSLASTTLIFCIMLSPALVSHKKIELNARELLKLVNGCQVGPWTCKLYFWIHKFDKWCIVGPY